MPNPIMNGNQNFILRWPAKGEHLQIRGVRSLIIHLRRVQYILQHGWLGKDVEILIHTGIHKIYPPCIRLHLMVFSALNLV